MPYWSQGPARPFVSGRVVPGLGFARLALAAGYGKPHWLWAGLEGIGTLTIDCAAAQAGLHLSAVLIDLSVIVRRTAAFEHTFIPVRDSVRSRDLEQANQAGAKSNVVEASLSGALPYGRWLLTWELTYVRPLGQSSSLLLYEEIQRIPITSRGVVTSKLGPMVNLSTGRQFYLGMLAEHLSLLGRNDGLVFRIGPSAWIELSRHWNLFGYVTWPVNGPDHLGAWNGGYGGAGLLYQFATGESRGRLL
jgi:hypothetical protein